MTQLNNVKEEPTKKLLFPYLIVEYLPSCLIAQSDIIILDIGEKKIIKKTEADIRKAREAEVKARQPPKPSKGKQSTPMLASSDHQKFVNRRQFLELQQQVITLQRYFLQLRAEFADYKESHPELCH